MKSQTIPGYAAVRIARLASEHNRREYAKWCWWTAAGLLSLAAWTGLWLLVKRLAGW